MTQIPSIISDLLNPEAIRKALTEKDFYFFVTQAWSVIDPAPMVQARHIKIICDTLQKCATREIQNLVINVPPGHSKSLITTVFFPAWVWINSPQERFICASHSLRLATDHSVLCRTLIESRWYQDRWGDRFRLKADNNLKTAFSNDRGGHRHIASPGIGTGDSAEFVLVDDAHEIGNIGADALAKVTSWFDTTLGSRIRDPELGVRIVIGQRVCVGDLTDHVLKSGNYKHLCFPSEYDPNHPHPCEEDWRTGECEPLWPERYSSEKLQELKVQFGSAAYATLHQQRPTPAGGNIIKTEWLRYYSAAELPATFDMKVMSWDLASKDGKDNDYSVGQVWGKKGGDCYLLDQIKGKWEFPELIRQFKAFIAKHPTVTLRLIEDTSNGTPLIQTLRREISGIIPVRPSKSKIERLNALSPIFESGNVLLPSGAPWLSDFVAELTSFPNAPHDDCVDAASQALDRLTAGGGVRTSNYY